MLSLLRLIDIVFKVLEYSILIEVILSWVYAGRTNKYIEIVHEITGPLLKPGRKIQERYFSNTMIDFSPIIALAILMLARKIIFGILI